MAGASHIEELRLDLEEVVRLLALADRQRCKGALSIEKGRIEAEILQKEKAHAVGKSGDAKSGISQRPAYSTTTIKTYGWDQSDKFVKIYVTLNEVGTLPAANVTVEYREDSFRLVAHGLRDSNHQLAINGFLKPIIAEDSHYKIKPDSVVIFLKKKDQGNKWGSLTQVEQRIKDKKNPTPKMDNNQDPGGGMMDLMKKMYDEGDDDMKRTIAKAWTESRDKQTGGMM